MLPDFIEEFLAQKAAWASAHNISLDTRYWERFPNVCPLCGRDPAPGVAMGSWIDFSEARLVPYWACVDCANTLENSHPEKAGILNRTIEARIRELVGD